MTEQFTGRKAAFVAAQGRASPAEGVDNIVFWGLGIAYSTDTKEIGLALSTSFTNRHRYSWAYVWQKKKCQRSALADSFFEAFKWYDLATIHEVLRVPASVVMKRLQDGQSAAMLFKPAGFDRLAKARFEGIEWGGRKMKLTEWCEFLGVHYITLCARLSNPNMPMEKVMQRGRVLGGKQRNQHITPDVKHLLIANRISYQTFYSRMKAGWSVKDACTKQPRHYHFRDGRPLEAQPQAPDGARLQPNHLLRDAAIQPDQGAQA